jgi:hypothetical protein
MKAYLFEIYYKNRYIYRLVYAENEVGSKAKCIKSLDYDYHSRHDVQNMVCVTIL